MTAKPLLIGQPVTAKGDLPSPDLVQIIQALCREATAQAKAIEALTARVEALEP